MSIRSLPNLLLFTSMLFCAQVIFAQTKETEPNNTPDKANTATLNNSFSGKIDPAGDVDWIKVKTNADGKLTLSVTSVGNKYLNIELFDTAGITSLGSKTYILNTYDFGIDGLAAGTYFAKITTTSAADTCSYLINPSLQEAPVANDKEPNNNRGQALTLNENSSTTGHIGYYYNNQRDTSDWYKITTTKDGRLDLTLTSNNGTYISVYLYDNDGITQLNSKTYIINPNTMGTDGLAAGTYYAKIIATSSSTFAPYTLKSELIPPAKANDKEPNNSKAEALTLNENSTTTGHVGYYYNNKRDTSDWYKITTTKDGRLDLILTSENGTYVSIYLYDNDGTTQLNAKTYIINKSTMATDGLAAGTYYAKIVATSSATFAPYTLTDSLVPPAQASDKEPNNDRNTAIDFSINKTVTGLIGYYYNNKRDTSDWYKITLPADGQLDLTLTSNNGTYISIYLYDNNGTTQLNAKTYIINASTMSTDGLAAGTYYLKVIATSANSFAPYTLTNALKTYGYAADTMQEPNNYAFQAKTLLSNRETPGHVGFYYNLSRDTTDWWKINYTGSGALKITINVEPNINNNSIPYYSYYIYKDTAQNPIASGTYRLDASLDINLSSLSQQYYYIKILGTSSSSYFAYSIANSYTQINIAKIVFNKAKSTLNSQACGGDSLTYDLSGSHSPYTVRLYKNNKLFDSTITTASVVTFKGLAAGEYYATAFGDGATDEAFGKSAVSTIVPPMPISLNTSNIGVHTATLQWGNVGCADYYKLQYRAVGNGIWTEMNTNGNTSTMNLTGLDPYTLYSWRVATADSLDGKTFLSAYSDSITFRTLSDTAKIALIYKGVKDCNNDTLRFEATNSQPPYTVTLYRNGSVYNTLSVNDTASFYNVPPGNYYATATGTGSGGSYGTSETTTVQPPAPTGLDTSGITSNSVHLNWNGLSCATDYQVYYRLEGSKTWTSTTSGTNNYEVTGLLPDTVYVWKVSASNAFNGQTVTSDFSDSATFRTLSTLPVAFVSFNGKLQGTNAVLTWTTSSEIENAGYEVQKSLDGTNFSAIGFVKGAGNSTMINNYSFTDTKVGNGTNYYRLKQIDVDGRYKYSSTIKLDYLSFSWNVAGYAGDNNKWVQLNLDRAAKVTIQLMSINGQIVQTINKGHLTQGAYTIPLHLADKSNGVYIVRLIVDQQIHTKKITK